jgi:hypothetical protein
MKEHRRQKSLPIPIDTLAFSMPNSLQKNTNITSITVSYFIDVLNQ